MEQDTAVLGITWYAQDLLGEIVFVDLPAVGTVVARDEPYAEIESVKAVSDVIAPVSGSVLEVNAALRSAPETLNSDPYGDAWLVRVRLVERAQLAALLDANAYRELVR